MLDLALDACCLINLCVADAILVSESSSISPGRRGGSGVGTAAKSGSYPAWRFHVPREVADESLYILRPDPDDARRLVKCRIDLNPYIRAGSLQPCHLDSPEEIDLFVQMAGHLGDGEAACFSLAAKRGWTLATDDRRAKRFAVELGVAVVTTPELVKRWTENTQSGDIQTVRILRNIQRLARFTPRPGAPEYQWWMDCLAKSEP